jgi:hypothetical protein
LLAASEGRDDNEVCLRKSVLTPELRSAVCRTV